MFDVELGGGGISCKYYHRQYEYNQISAALLLQDKKSDCCWGVLRGCPMCAVVSIKMLSLPGQKCLHYIARKILKFR